MPSCGSSGGVYALMGASVVIVWKWMKGVVKDRFFNSSTKWVSTKDGRRINRPLASQSLMERICAVLYDESFKEVCMALIFYSILLSITIYN